MAASADSGGAVNEASMSPVFIYNDSVIGPNFEWLWYCIPKNASRSLLRLFTAAGGARLRDFDDEARSSITHQNVKFSFAFARHPETRVVSTWRNKISRAPATPAQSKLIQKSPGLREGMELNEFVEWLGEALHRRRAVDKHWRPQSDYVCDKDGAIAVSFVGKIERLETDLAFVQPHVGDLEPLLHKNATVAEPDETLSDRSREILRYVYRRDFHIFGYE